MVNIFVWPWRNDEELLEVRQLLYPDARLESDVQLEKQQLGVNIVNTWKLRRCRIPHSIQATADLIDAILHHDARKNSASTIKAVYASALAKMVTSVCDLEQDSTEKRSMMEQAKKIGMPEDWVFLRHSITHGQTPGLSPLEDAVRDAVPWMWNHFWRHLDGDDQMAEEELRNEMIEILTVYRRQRRTAITTKQEASLDTNLASQTSKSIRRLCKKNSGGLEVLVSVLVHENIILPSEKQSSLKFKALLLIWNALLLQMVQRQAELHAKFTLELTRTLTLSSGNANKSIIELDMASKWVRHVLLDAVWASIISPNAMEGLRYDVIEACLLDKNDFTSTIIKEVLGAISGPQAESFKQLVELCNEENQSDSMDIDSDAYGEEAKAPPTGWSRPVAVWLPKPIGV